MRVCGITSARLIETDFLKQLQDPFSTVPGIGGRCARSTSPICAPAFITGLSARAGSCGISEISRPRISRNSVSYSHEIAAAKQNRSTLAYRVRRKQTEHRARQRTLPRAGLSQDPDDLSRANIRCSGGRAHELVRRRRNMYVTSKSRSWARYWLTYPPLSNPTTQILAHNVSPCNCLARSIGATAIIQARGPQQIWHVGRP